MAEVIIEAAEMTAVGVHALAETELAAFLKGRRAFVRAFAAVQDFKARAGQILVVPDAEGGVERVLFGLGAKGAADAMSFRALAAKLPGGDYRIASAPSRIPIVEPRNSPISCQRIAHEPAAGKVSTMRLWADPAREPELIEHVCVAVSLHRIVVDDARSVVRPEHTAGFRVD